MRFQTLRRRKLLRLRVSEIDRNHGWFGCIKEQMKVLVSDSSILIEFAKRELLDKMFDYGL